MFNLTISLRQPVIRVVFVTMMEVSVIPVSSRAASMDVRAVLMHLYQMLIELDSPFYSTDNLGKAALPTFIRKGLEENK